MKLKPRLVRQFCTVTLYYNWHLAPLYLCSPLCCLHDKISTKIFPLSLIPVFACAKNPPIPPPNDILLIYFPKDESDCFLYREKDWVLRDIRILGQC